MNAPFFPAPTQSPGLQANLPAPPPIAFGDLGNAGMLRTLKRRAQEYETEAVCKFQKIDLTCVVIAEDIFQAKDYTFGVAIASLLPQIVEAFPPLQEQHFHQQFADISIGINAILGRLDIVDARLNGIDARLNVTEIKASNAYAKDLDDAIAPPPRGVNLPGNSFPTTIRDLIALTAGPLLTEIENYYGFCHTDDLVLRIARVRTAYGVRSVL